MITSLIILFFLVCFNKYTKVNTARLSLFFLTAISSIIIFLQVLLITDNLFVLDVNSKTNKETFTTILKNNYIGEINQNNIVIYQDKTNIIIPKDEITILNPNGPSVLEKFNIEMEMNISYKTKLLLFFSKDFLIDKYIDKKYPANNDNVNKYILYADTKELLEKEE